MCIYHEERWGQVGRAQACAAYVSYSMHTYHIYIHIFQYVYTSNNKRYWIVIDIGGIGHVDHRLMHQRAAEELRTHTQRTGAADGLHSGDLYACTHRERKINTGKLTSRKLT